MSHVPRPSSADSVQTPPPTSTTRTAAPIGIAVNQSSLRPVAEPESCSCLSQIGSMISSLVSSISSWISSLWNYVTGRECTAADSATATSPADALIAKARNFFETQVLINNRCPIDQSKVALLITLNDNIIGSCVATIETRTERGCVNPFRALCNQGILKMEEILRRQTLNADSDVQLRIRVLNPLRTFTDSTGDSWTEQGGSIYDANFSASRDMGYVVMHGTEANPATVAEGIFRNIRCDGPDQEALQANVHRFFTNPSDTQTGWIYSI